MPEFKEIKEKEIKDYGRKYAAVCAAAAGTAAAAPLIAGIVANRKRKALDYNDLVSVSGAAIVNAGSDPVEIDGINLFDYVFGCRSGNDLVPGGTRSDFDVLRRRFGEYGAREIYGKCFENAVTPDDIKEIAKLGVNCVRLPVRSFLLFKNDKVKKKSTPHFKRLDKFIQKCGKAGIYVILTLADVPGYDPDKGEYRLFEMGRHSFSKRNEFVRMCSEISNHYKENPAVLGYEIPFADFEKSAGGKAGNIYNSLCIRTAKALRTLNDNHPLFAHLDTLPENDGEFSKLGIAAIVDAESDNITGYIAALSGKLPLIAVSDGAKISGDIDAEGICGIVSGYYKGGNPDICIYCKPKDFIDVSRDSYDEICEKISAPSKTENFMKMN
ncbi:MAG: cellulase family glycosylhydrolase [Clostridia bacterium]|nr:cellulase family glycosylhydrolase [Clostridia bacterium]